MATETASNGAGPALHEYEPLILVTRGDELPKKNYERKLHPTYETSIRIKNGGQQTSPHYVVKFYDQYKDLCDGLKALGVGEGLAISIDASFPLKYPKSFVGFTLTEQQLQHRCYMLNKWMGSIFANYHSFPTKAQLLISEFLSLNDNDAELEQNKELILALLRRKKENLLTEGIIQNTRNGAGAASNPTSNNSSMPTSLAGSSTGSLSPIRLTSAALTDNSNRMNNNTGGAIDTSMYDTNNPGLIPTTDSDLKDFARETIVGGFLGVTVAKGTQLVRKRDDSKLHHSYETFLRLLPLEEVVYNQGQGKAEIDPAKYDEQVATTQLSAVFAFDSYRELKNDLERVHVYSSDNPTDSSAARQNGYKVIVIDAPFPPTLKKSALGVALTEQQVEQRAAMMNNWLGILLKNFNVLPRDGKELITDFLGMPSVYSDQAAMSPQFNTIHNILRGQYVPPKVANTNSPSRGSSSPKRTVVSFFRRNNTNNTNNSASSNSLSNSATPNNNPNNRNSSNVGNNVAMVDNSVYDVTTNVGASTTSTAASNNNTNNSGIAGSRPDDNVSLVSGGDAMTDAGVEATGSEVMVGQYLGFSVMRGKSIAKKVGEKSTHPSYEILMRILPLEETLLPETEKRLIDDVVFNQHVEAGPVRLAFAFDAYRGLKSDLEAFRVYSLDRKSEVDSMLAKNPNDPVVLIDARFPRTYQRQSIGLKLNEPQLNQRSVMLNQWFGALMQSFHLLPFAAKDRVVTFLSAQNTATVAQGVGLQPLQNPRDAVILAMLRGTYTPELKKATHSIFGSSNNGAGGSGAQGGDSNSGKKNKKNKKNKGGDNTEDNVGEGQCAPGGACVVM